MRITVFGATGPAGRLVVRRAHDQGHQVTAYVRNPAKLDEGPGLTVVSGELDDAAAIRTAVTGTDAVISLLGPGRDKASIAPLVPGLQAIVDAMTWADVRRKGNVKDCEIQRFVLVPKPDGPSHWPTSTMGLNSYLLGGGTHSQVGFLRQIGCRPHDTRGPTPSPVPGVAGPILDGDVDRSAA